METVVTVGAGQAGMQFTASLREGGFRGRIVLIGDEPWLPYQRPPLSKDYLDGTVDRDAILLNPSRYFDAHSIEFRRAARVEAIDREAARVELSSGETIAYDHLVLATGSRNRMLSVIGSDLRGVHQLRTIDDADALKAAMASARSVVVIGAGFIGLELAAWVSKLRVPVTVIEAAGRPMARALSADAAGILRNFHECAGVRFLCNTSVTAMIGRQGTVDSVMTSDGNRIPADVVVVGIGAVPSTELAAAAGLKVADGILVDAQLQTSDSAISAIGDCARFPCKYAASGDARLESVQNAADQGRALASRLLGRPAAPYTTVPWFWSVQGEHKLQIAGLTQPHDAAIVLRAADGRGVSVLCFRDNRFIGAETINQQRDHMASRKLLNVEVSLTPDEANIPGFSLADYAKRCSPP
ncbi:pyridine nucleotide-disulfide oxidoreductase [Burkholderia multivorans]|nr:pyridine nucleotide-disulfide oxidoreductase [Burkholderia multivorans]